jgi:uncharacterized membrane protein
MVMVWLRLFHIVAGVFWVGSAAYGAFFVMPTARAAGPEGGRFVGQLMQRMGPALGIAMLFTIVPGFILYGQLSAGFNRAWATTPTGLALGAGALATILAVVAGIVVNAPTRKKMVALRAGLEAHGGRPGDTEAAELARLQARIERGAQVVAVLLLLAAGAMAVARYL